MATRLTKEDYDLWDKIEMAAADEREAVQRYVDLECAVNQCSMPQQWKAEAIRLSRMISAMEMEHAEWLARLSSDLSGVLPSRELDPSVTVPQGSWPSNLTSK